MTFILMKRDAWDVLMGIQKKLNMKMADEKAALEELIASGCAPFFDDVASEMVALCKLRDGAGRELPIEELYERACWAQPDVRHLLIQRIKEETIMDYMRRQAAVRDEIQTIRTAGNKNRKRRGKK